MIVCKPKKDKDGNYDFSSIGLPETKGSIRIWREDPKEPTDYYILVGNTKPALTSARLKDTDLTTLEQWLTSKPLFKKYPLEYYTAGNRTFSSQIVLPNIVADKLIAMAQIL